MIQSELTKPHPGEIGALLRGELDLIGAWVKQVDLQRTAMHVCVIVAGVGCYGAAVGCWRSPQQALYTAIKLPLIILLTTVGNSLLNAMLAPLLGLPVSFRQSFSLILMSYTAAAAILGAFSPLIAFVIWNTPPITPRNVSDTAYNLILLANVLAIALAGIAGNVRLFQLLKHLGGSALIARRVLLAWLGGNMFLGAQLCWNLRPFVGAPDLDVEFLRRNAFEGNFYEAVYHALKHSF